MISFSRLCVLCFSKADFRYGPIGRILSFQKLLAVNGFKYFFCIMMIRGISRDNDLLIRQEWHAYLDGIELYLHYNHLFVKGMCLMFLLMVVVYLNKLLNKHLGCRRFETPCRCNVIQMVNIDVDELITSLNDLSAQCQDHRALQPIRTGNCAG